MYYYVYRITNKTLKKHYCGKRTTKIPPHLDLGIRYFSSSKDKEFIKDQKAFPENYKYKIVRCCKSSSEAVSLEIKLHNMFNVSVNSAFYNRAKQTSTKFDTSGVQFTEAQRAALSRSQTGRKHSPETKEKMRASKLGNSWNKGKKHTEQSIQLMKSKQKRGKDRPNAVLVDVYNYLSNTVVAEKVVLGEWCRENKITRSNLAATLKTDRTKPSTKYNPWQAQGLYARYSSA